jgi:hypothetical protein
VNPKKTSPESEPGLEPHDEVLTHEEETAMSSEQHPEPPVDAAKQEKAKQEITHGEPILTQGATGDKVRELADLLKKAGYEHNTIAKGENAHAILDNTVMSDVERFIHDHEIKEDDQMYEGRDAGVNELRGRWIGPQTWQKLHDLAGD